MTAIIRPLLEASAPREPSGPGPNLAQSRKAARCLKALAHEGRLSILWILAAGETSVGDIERILDLRQPAVSQQLARLRADGLVATRREGKVVYYSLAGEQARRIVAAVREAFSHVAEDV